MIICNSQIGRNSNHYPKMILRGETVDTQNLISVMQTTVGGFRSIRNSKPGAFRNDFAQ